MYTVTFEATWSEATHPTDFPSGDPHFSGLIGALHNDGTEFWRTGQIATSGIQQMAETGSKSLLTNEVNDAIANGTAEQLLSGSGIGRSPGSAAIGPVVVNQSHPLLTLVSMIAPSPDWFVGVSALTLVDSDGNWINEQVIELAPYDAGTDSGPSYQSPNAATTPRQPIANIEGVAPFSSEPIGTFRVTRTDAPTQPTGDIDCDDQVNAADSLAALQYRVGLLSDGGDCPLGDGSTQVSVALGDVNQDGIIDTIDALMLAQCAAGLVNDLCPTP